MSGDDERGGKGEVVMSEEESEVEMSEEGRVRWR